MISILSMNHKHELEMDVPIENINDTTRYLWSWIDFSEPTPSESALLSDFFNFHPLAIEDCLYVLQRPKIDYYDDYQFLVLHAIRPDSLANIEVNLFVGHNFIVSYHHAPVKEVNEAWNEMMKRSHDKKLHSHGPFTVAYTIIDALVDQYFPCVYGIEDELDELEKWGAHESVELLMKQVFELRGRLLKLRRTIVPMRDMMYRILNSQHVQNEKEQRAYFSDIYDHLLKLSEMIDSDREMTADLRDSYISLNSNRMNSIMKTLTVITTIFMPLTLIAGIYGMNFYNMPELTWKYGYVSVLAIMGGLTIWMITWFIRRGWFK